MQKIDPQYIENIRENARIRRRLGHEDPLWFSLLYLKHHFTSPLAPFHLEMFHLVRQEPVNFVAVMAFRESGKSTVLNLAQALWSILGRPGKKLVVIVSKTQDQAKNHFANIKAELQHNEWLKEDFGPFTERPEEWQKLSLELEYHGAKIISVTPAEGLRGMKYQQYRPDLIICDDLQDGSADLKESTRVLLDRFDQEILPLGMSGTRVVVLGNYIGEHSFMVRLEQDIRADIRSGVFRTYPLQDERGKVLWPEKFTAERIRQLKERLPYGAWSREYQLEHSNSYGVKHDHNSPFMVAMRRAQERMPSNPFDKNPFAQVPLISQMRRYTILTPAGREAMNEDPHYKARLQALADTWDEEYRKELWRK